MKRVEDPELFDAQSTNGHVTLYDGRGHVLGYVDPVTRIQTDTHGRAVARCPRSDALPIAAETLAGHVPRTGSPVGGGERDLAQSLALELGVVTEARHRLADRAEVIRDALRELRLGRSVPVVQAHLEEAMAQADRRRGDRLARA